jgi:major membrane immunogen (membrane-anchored lipoprotein)
MNNFKNWVTTANTSGQILGKNFFVNGFNFDYKTNMGTMSKDDAEAAGIDVNQFKTSLGARGKYEASYNPLFGESKPSEVDITQGYINSLGGMNASVKHERQQRRKDRRAQRAEHRAYNSAAGLSTKDTDTSNDFNVLTTDEK